jgi:hypothetical protein
MMAGGRKHDLCQNFEEGVGRGTRDEGHGDEEHACGTWNKKENYFSTIVFIVLVKAPIM